MAPLSRVVYALALLKLAIHLVFINGYGFFRDEFYYLACGRHLSWGYVDHPPLAAWLCRLVTSIFGESLIAIRVPPALAGAATVILTGYLARELGGARFAQGLAALCAVTVPWWLAIQHTFQMNAFEPLFWMGCALLYVRIRKSGNQRLWLWFGVLAGFGLLNKHSLLIFGFGFGAGLVLARDWKSLTSRWCWAGSVLAFLIYLPHIVWQAANGWPIREFTRNAVLYKNAVLPPVAFLMQQIMPMNPLTFPVWFGGLAALLVVAKFKTFRALGWTYLVAFVTFYVMHGKNYYLAPAYPMLLAAGGVLFEQWRWRQVLVWAVTVSGVVILPFGIPVLKPETFIRYAKALHVEEVPEERHEVGPLPQFYADMFGWKEMAAEVARIYHTLPPEDQARACVFGQNYGEAGAVEYYANELGLPPAISGHNSYFLWGAGRCGQLLIVIGGNETRAKELFEEVIPAGKTFHPYAMPYENNRVIWICRKPKTDLKSVWPALKGYG